MIPHSWSFWVHPNMNLINLIKYISLININHPKLEHDFHSYLNVDIDFLNRNTEENISEMLKK